MNANEFKAAVAKAEAIQAWVTCFDGEGCYVQLTKKAALSLLASSFFAGTIHASMNDGELFIN